MKRALATVATFALLLGLGALAVLARGGGDALTPASSAALAISPRSAAAPAAPVTEAAVNAPAAAPDAPMVVTTKYNWIALPLRDPSLVMASDLKAHIEANSSGTVSVMTVEEWNSIGQTYRTFTTVPIPFGDFALAVGGVYRVSVSGNGGAQVVWSMVGDVPDPNQFSYTLRETAGSDYNWIMLPLQKGALTMASQLAADINANSHPSVTVITVEQWNAVGQTWRTYTTVPFPFGDFAIYIGYPYRITVTAPSPGTWP